MRILVFGAGALGSFFGGMLSLHHDVTLLGRHEHMTAVREKGLSIWGLTELHVEPYAALSCCDVSQPDLVILTVKSYDTANAAADLSGWLAQDIPVLSLQNGLGNVESLRGVLPNPLLAGTTSQGVTFLGPGRVTHAGTGDTVIGDACGSPEPGACEVSEMLTRAGIEAFATEDIMGEIWVKAAINAAINPLTAISGLPNGGLLKVVGLRDLMEEISRECMRVMEAAGIGLEGRDVASRALGVAARTAQNRSSMLQDVEKGQRTEIDSICGELSRVGMEHGIETPYNDTLLALVRALEP